MQKRWIILLAYFFFCAGVTAQQYPFVYYTPKDGLVNSRVRKAYQDSKGRMYFLTYGGLSVYDGARFRNYTKESGLVINMVNDILEVGEDSLLVAVNVPHLHTLVKGVIGTLKTENNFSPLVNQLLKSEDGSIYVSADDGLFCLKGHRFEKLPLPGFDNLAFDPFLGSMVEFHDYLVFTTNDLRGNRGLYLYDKKFRKVADAITDITVNYIGKDIKGRIWICQPNKITLLDSNFLHKGKLQFIPPPGFFSQLNDISVVDMNFDEENIWINNRGQEIIRIGKDPLLRMLMPELKVNLGMQSIFIDREKNTWLSNDGAGVFKLINAGMQITDNLMPGVSITLATSFGDTTWFGSTGKRIMRKVNSSETMFETNTESPYFIISQSNNKLIGSGGRFIYEAALPGKTDKRIHFRKIVELPDTLVFGRGSLTEKNGHIIIAMSDKIGVWNNNQLLFGYPILPSDAIEGMQFDDMGRLWLVTRYTGLTAFSLHPENPSNYLQVVFSFPELAQNLSPRCMVIDKKGIIWVGTRTDGLLAHSFEGNHLKRIAQYKRSNGLTDDFVTSLACDMDNNIIVGTQTGLDRITENKDNHFIENITKSSNYFGYIKQVWASTDNSTYAVTNTGVLLKVPGPIKKSLGHEPEFFVEEIKLNGLSLSASRKVFRYNENNLSLSIAAPTFIDEKQVQFAYLLEGAINAAWSDTSTKSVIDLVNLPVGKYNLKMKAFFPSTPYSPRELAYSFVINPPWWKTWGFRIPAGLLLIAAIMYAIRSYYRRKLERHKAVLEQQQAVEKERTRIATDMHDDLGAGLSRIKFLSETMGIKQQRHQAIDEEIFKIREYSHEMIDKMGEIVWALNERNDSLSDLLSYTRSYAVEYLSSNGIECTVETPDQFPATFVSGEFRRNIYLTVKEALHNIFKHSQATTVHIVISADRNLEILIQDNGIGFDKRNIKPFRNGLSNMEARIKEIHGRLEIVSGKGTLVKILAPLPE